MVVYTHTYVQNYFQIDPKEQCVDALTKMSSCPACQGIPEILPCPDYCVNVMKGCLAYHAELGDSWDNFIGEQLRRPTTYRVRQNFDS